MRILKIITLIVVIQILSNCEKSNDISNSLINTTWISTENYNCTKPEGCVGQQIIKFNSENEFTYENIDGQHGTYDRILNGAYTYSHPEFILHTEEGTLSAMMINGNSICLDS
jgi:hypothetical protein